MVALDALVPLCLLDDDDLVDATIASGSDGADIEELREWQTTGNKYIRKFELRSKFKCLNIPQTRTYLSSPNGSLPRVEGWRICRKE